MRRSAGAVGLKLIGALLIASMWSPLFVAAQTSGKIGYVDLKRLLDNAPQMIDSRAKLEQRIRSARYRAQGRRRQTRRAEATLRAR